MEQQVIPSDYTQYAEAVEIIKHAIERCRYRSAAAVNKETLSLYFGVGKFVSENSRIGCWGTKALPTISKLLQRELPGLHGFSESGLKRMRSFYEEWRTFLIRPTVLGELENHSSEKGTALIHPTALGELDIDEHLLLQLIGQPVNTEFTWDDFVKISFSHHIEILTRSKDIAERLFYIHCAAQNAWSLSSLKNYLKEDIYSNRGSLPSNFLQVLPEAIYAVKATLAFKDEYMLEMVNLENVGEREQDWNDALLGKTSEEYLDSIKDAIVPLGAPLGTTGYATDKEEEHRGQRGHDQHHDRGGDHFAPGGPGDLADFGANLTDELGGAFHGRSSGLAAGQIACPAPVFKLRSARAAIRGSEIRPPADRP